MTVCVGTWNNLRHKASCTEQYHTGTRECRLSSRSFSLSLLSIILLFAYAICFTLSPFLNQCLSLCKLCLLIPSQLGPLSSIFHCLFNLPCMFWRCFWLTASTPHLKAQLLAWLYEIAEVLLTSEGLTVRNISRGTLESQKQYTGKWTHLNRTFSGTSLDGSRMFDIEFC